MNAEQGMAALPPRKQALIAAAAAIAVAGGGLLLATQYFKSPPEIPELAPVRVPPGSFRPTQAQLSDLKIEAVRLMTFRGGQFTDGVIASNDDATTPVFSPYTGRVSRVLVRQGETVRAGTPLMAVEAAEFVQGQNDLVAAVAGLATARAQLELAQNAEKRQHELYLAKSGALKDWLQSQSDLIAARSAHRGAEIALEAARNRLRILGKTAQEISALQAQDGASPPMNPEALVRAPIAGTVIQRQVGAGQYIQSAAAGAANPLFSIADLSTVWLVANVREADAPELKLGQPLELRVLALPQRLFKGRISWIASSIDPNTRRLQVRAEIDNRDGALKPAMFASFHVLSGDPVSAPGVPRSAVVYEGSQAHVFVARPDGTLALRAIRTGRDGDDDMVQVESGLAAGERIVTRGALFIDRATEDSPGAN